jgi:arabinose-5-phosphate isomerase
MYIQQIQASDNSIASAISTLSRIVCNKRVYMTGIGKSGLIAQKCVATWQSLGLRTHYLLAQDMLHGDIGVIENDDVIIYLSNSGNTEELIPICSYIQTNFKVTQVLLCNNPDPLLDAYVDVTCVIGKEKITEIDYANFAPTVSSVVFMICLDVLGVQLSSVRSLIEMKRNHPGGNLGKR